MTVGVTVGATVDFGLPEVTASGVTLNVASAKGGKEEALEFDVVLVATGRKPFTEGLGLEEMGIEMDKLGRVVVDEHFKTKARATRRAARQRAGEERIALDASRACAGEIGRSLARAEDVTSTEHILSRLVPCALASSFPSCLRAFVSLGRPSHSHAPPPQTGHIVLPRGRTHWGSRYLLRGILMSTWGFLPAVFRPLRTVFRVLAPVS